MMSAADAQDPDSRLAGVSACVFDAYGTIFQVDSACMRLQGQLGPSTGALAALWRDKQLQYTWLRTVQDRHADFAQVTRDALAHALQVLHLDPDLEPALMQAFDALDIYPDVVPVLEQLRARGYRTAILSNGTPGMLANLLAHAGVEALFDAVYSVEAAGAFKPHPRVYRIPGDRLGLRPGQICFVSSNAWDAHGASAFGMRVAWCNRKAQAPDRLPGAPDVQMQTLAELPGRLPGRAGAR